MKEVEKKKQKQRIVKKEKNKLMFILKYKFNKQILNNKKAFLINIAVFNLKITEKFLHCSYFLLDKKQIEFESAVGIN